MVKTKKEKVNLENFFKKGFEPKTWKNVESGNTYKYLQHDKFQGKFGETNRIYFEDKDGEEIRLLVKGQTFVDAIENCVAIGDLLKVFKNSQGYWEFEFSD